MSGDISKPILRVGSYEFWISRTIIYCPMITLLKFVAPFDIPRHIKKYKIILGWVTVFVIMLMTERNEPLPILSQNNIQFPSDEKTLNAIIYHLLGFKLIKKTSLNRHELKNFSRWSLWNSHLKKPYKSMKKWP